MAIIFTVLAIIACCGVAALFFGTLVAMLATLANKKWGWFIAIILTLPVASTYFSAGLKGDQRWVYTMLVTGWLLPLPLLLFFLVIFIDNGFELPLLPVGGVD